MEACNKEKVWIW